MFETPLTVVGHIVNDLQRRKAITGHNPCPYRLRGRLDAAPAVPRMVREVTRRTRKATPRHG